LVVVLYFLCFAVISLFTKASHDRDWSLDQKVLPEVSFRDMLVDIKNIRNFSYTSTSTFEVVYYDKVFDINKLKKVWYFVEPFEGIPGSAHTFLSFEFEDDNFVSVSVEVRKEVGELYHPIKGLFNKYELMYVIGDEKDLVKLRTNFRKDDVYMYEVDTTKEKAVALFVDILKRVETLKDKPEFYNTVWNTCTSNIVSHVNEITPKKIPFWDMRILFPEYSDILAFEVGLLKTDSLDKESRKRYLINEKAMKFADDTNFSRKIRE
jgi:hypothetical protein